MYRRYAADRPQEERSANVDEQRPSEGNANATARTSAGVIEVPTPPRRRLRPRVAKLQRLAEPWVNNGFGVFLVEPNGKAPLGELHPHGHKDATGDLERFVRGLTRFPAANYGLVPPEGVLVLDVDPRDGGDEALARLEATHGPLPVSTRVRTSAHEGRQGFHIYLRAEGLPDRKRLIGRGLEAKVGNSGYLLGPGSVHPRTGEEYELVTGSPEALAEAPEWLRDLAAGAAQTEPQSMESGASWSVGIGERHTRLVSLAGSLIQLGFTTEDELAGALGAIQARFDNSDGEVPREIINTARDAANRWGGQHQAEFEAAVAKELRQIEVRTEARRRQAAKAQPDIASLLPPAGRTLADELAEAPEEVAFAIDRLHPAGGNALLVAQYKAGKTTLLLNLVKALADGEPFLGQFDVAPLAGRVAYFNYELDAAMFGVWARDLGIAHPERVAAPLHLRGAGLPFWHDAVAEQLIAWLRQNEVEFLILDPAARAWRGLVDNENDNAAVAVFTDTLDAIKREAGVPNLVLSTHTGRLRPAENEERSRGATRLEDWMDAGLYLTSDSHGRRALRASGRDVDVEAIDLDYDDWTRRLSTSGQTRRERREDEGVQRVLDTLATFDEPPTTKGLSDALTGEKEKRSGWIKAAAVAGYLERRYTDETPHDERESPRPGAGLYCSLTDRGRAFLEGHAERVREAEDE